MPTTKVSKTAHKPVEASKTAAKAPVAPKGPEGTPAATEPPSAPGAISTSTVVILAKVLESLQAQLQGLEAQLARLENKADTHMTWFAAALQGVSPAQVIAMRPKLNGSAALASEVANGRHADG